MFRASTTVYQAILSPLAALALVLLVAWLMVSLVRRDLPALLVVALALLVGIVSRIALLGYMHAMFFPAFGNWPSYVTPLYPMLLLFVGVTLAGSAIEAIAMLKTEKARRFVEERGLYRR